MNKVLKEEVKNIGVHPDLKNALVKLKPMGLSLRDMGEMILREFLEKPENAKKVIIDNALKVKNVDVNAEKKRIAKEKFENELIAIDMMHPVAA
tara:strand:- start:544 stop:825 length:282 start_codon:yes stop_codon:yes gene_type:complete